ncbi:hypothetical protein P7C71_g3954, partial [Lecanoromycetidae sp. Uapishka_2]
MPFIPHTPESLIPRSDSKNPATTCKGITASGRPCRRPLLASPQASPSANRGSKQGVVAVLEEDDEGHDGAAAFFCWQHQDQATSLTSGDKNGRNANIVRLQERTSIDTLAERLGVVDIDDDEQSSGSQRKQHHIRPARKDTLPQKWQEMDGPLLAVHTWKHRPRNPTPKRRAESNLGLFCCVRTVDRDALPPPRPRSDTMTRRDTHKGHNRLPSTVQMSQRRRSHGEQPSEHPSTVTATGSALPFRVSGSNRPNEGAGRPHASRDPPSQTQSLLSLIPSHLSPQTTSTLLAELAKPVSPHDEEGYIYMFWLTGTSVSDLELQSTSSMLSETPASTPNGRRRSGILQAHAPDPDKSKLLLKIGRASNVQRRMNEWTRQCGYELSLLRFYPYVPTPVSRPNTSTAPASLLSPQKVPHAHKVERLIHIELADLRVKRNCHSCGKEHREWFEVESSREGLKMVDGILRRWVEWSMNKGRS